ncbi:hypothetical protein MKY82_09970 [Paenibacillus sp. FSL W7-1279]|nr:hypothetical protein [Paenibacillus sp. JZ16]
MKNSGEEVGNFDLLTAAIYPQDPEIKMTFPFKAALPKFGVPK